MQIFNIEINSFFIKKCISLRHSEFSIRFLTSIGTMLGNNIPEIDNNINIDNALSINNTNSTLKK